MESESSRVEASVISPELVEPPPRRVELTGKGLALAIVTVAIIATTVVYVSFVATEAARQIRVRNELRGVGNETEAQIARLHNPLQAPKEYVDYTFIADGKSDTGEAIVPLEDHHTIGSASSLTIRYLPQNPTVNHPADWEWSPMSEWDGYMAVVLIAGLGCLFFIPPQILFERRLAIEGVAVTGVVRECSESGRNNEFITLGYDFPAQDGVLWQGRGSFQARQEIGAKILVLYLPENPKRNAPYPLSNWRIA
jgi:hypothetical protein